MAILTHYKVYLTHTIVLAYYELSTKTPSRTIFHRYSREVLELIIYNVVIIRVIYLLDKYICNKYSKIQILIFWLVKRVPNYIDQINCNL